MDQARVHIDLFKSDINGNYWNIDDIQLHNKEGLKKNSIFYSIST